MRHRRSSRSFQLFFFQTLLCLLLAAACLSVRYIKSSYTLPAGTFASEGCNGNLTFSDLAAKLCGQQDGEK